ncbi:MAG: proprotein convertase P-domain-containing protein [Chloroflexi bacterium]|nr:proprotein convertase P-domain-containing protein [Chloroflexota bacterium]
MRRWFRALIQSLILLFTVGLLLTFVTHLPVASAEDPPVYYQNNETFDQLSGVARSLLELRYGRKEGNAPTIGAQGESGALAPQGGNPPPAYTDDETFEKLSGAARSLLEAKFGRKAAGATTADTPAGTKEDRAAAEAEAEAAEEEATEAPPGFPIGPLAVVDNILVNNPTSDTTAQDTQSETALVLAGSTLVAAWNDSGSFVLPSGNQFTGYGRSTNGGLTWTDGVTLPASLNGDAGDPVLAHDNTLGRTYFSTLIFTATAGLPVFRSNNGAASWLAPVEGAPGFGNLDFLDKEWIAVDNFAGVGNGNVYMVFRDFDGDGSAPFGGIYLTRSTDGGATFGSSGGTLIAPEGAFNVQGAFVAVGTNHEVYVFWLDQSAGSFTPNLIMMRKSTNQGLTFGPPITVADLDIIFTNGDLLLNGGFRTSSFPQVAVNPVNGHLYLVFNDNPATSDKADVFFTISTNGGTTWSAPVRVNDDSTRRDQFMPAIAVTPDGTRLSITFYDRRLDPGNSQIDRFGVIGTISGGTVTFGSNFRITTSSFPVVIGVDPVINPVYMGDYDMMAADNNFFYTTWGDNRDQSLAVPSRKNANVRSGRYPVAGPGVILTLVSASLAPGCGNGNGLIDLNECNKLDIILQNVGTITASGLIANLSISTPGVVITQPNVSPYLNIAPGATGTNVGQFKFNTSPTFTAGAPISFTLAVTTPADGVFVFPFQMTSNISPTTPVRFDNNTPLNIADLSTVTSTLAVSGIVSPVAQVTVSLYLTHTFDSDLNISLVGPDGTTVDLSSNNGGGGDNFGSACSPDSSRTTFDDTAATAITAGFAPFVGTFRPEGSLATFKGKTGAAVNGTWSLRLADVVGGDSGVLQCWSLFISSGVGIDAGGAGCIENFFLPVILK